MSACITSLTLELEYRGIRGGYSSTSRPEARPISSMVSRNVLACFPLKSGASFALGSGSGVRSVTVRAAVVPAAFVDDGGSGSSLDDVSDTDRGGDVLRVLPREGILVGVILTRRGLSGRFETFVRDGRRSGARGREGGRLARGANIASSDRGLCRSWELI